MADKCEGAVAECQGAKIEGKSKDVFTQYEGHYFWMADDGPCELSPENLMRFYRKILKLKRCYQIEEPKHFEVLDTICKRISRRLKDTKGVIGSRPYH